MIIVALSMLSFISALDVTIIATALPLITEEIGGATQYVWIANSFVFASAVLQPLIGQLANILGRRPPLMASIILFMLGSGIAGGAINPAMLIGGRTVQGLGAGGIYVLIDIVCCDLVPLRERGKYLAIVNVWAAVAAALGPVIGGLLAQSNWRWIFYMNIPICVIPLVVIVIFMRVKTGGGDLKIRNLDFMGNGIFTVSMVSLLFGLVTGGVRYSWGSWRVIVPIVLGVAGWTFFHVQQHFLAHNPSVPTRLFSNRTSASGLAQNFLGAVLLQAAGYFLPVYFQAVLGTTILTSGVNFIPMTIGTLLFAAIGGISLSKFGVYRPIHAAMFMLSALGFSLFTTLNRSSPKVAWAFFEIITSALGMTVSTLLPAVLASLPESDVASASAVFSFIKTFGFVWGVTIPGIIFNAVINNNLFRVSSPDLRSRLSDGAAYSFASQAHSKKRIIEPRLWSEVVDVYIIALKAIWWFGFAVSILGLLTVGLERGLELSSDLKTEYGIDNERQEPLKVEVDGNRNAPDALDSPST
jgi:EmrB/QacA subfamily drug resistance transporter